MTLDEFENFVRKYDLYKNLKYDPKHAYAPASLIYSHDVYLTVADCEVEYKGPIIKQIYLKFNTRVRTTFTYEDACKIFDSDFMPIIKQLKINIKIKDMEKDFV